MARISEFEQSSYDSIEVAITAEEYANLGTLPGQLHLKVGLFKTDGSDSGTPESLSTTQSDWTLDQDTGEYVYTLKDHYYQHNLQYQGIALASVDLNGEAIEVYDAYMIGTFNGTYDFNEASDTVTSSSWLPIGTIFTDIQQNHPVYVTGGNGVATVRWDAPNIDSPLVEYGSGLDDTGTAPPVCFTMGTKIATAMGEIPIEDLQPGDLVLTRENGLQPIRWIGSRKVAALELITHPDFRPVCIEAGALCCNTPDKRLTVSQQHRILVRSKIAQHMFDTNEILVGAKHLTELEGIYIDDKNQDVEYFHLLFDRHEIVIANNAETESLYTGPETMKSLGDAALAEIFALFPELKNIGETANPAPAKPFVSGKRGRQLVARHIKHRRKLIC